VASQNKEEGTIASSCVGGSSISRTTSQERAKFCPTTRTNTIAARRKEEAKDPTIQRELSPLQKILNHARISQSFLASLSPFHDRVLLKMPSSSNCDHKVDAGVRGIVSAAFRYGFRKEELQDLLCRQANFADKKPSSVSGHRKELAAPQGGAGLRVSRRNQGSGEG
jgi:hypothetical protein